MHELLETAVASPVWPLLEAELADSVRESLDDVQDDTYFGALPAAVCGAAEGYAGRIFRSSVAFVERFYREQDVMLGRIFQRIHFRHHGGIITLSRGPLIAVQAVLLDDVPVDPSLYTVTGGAKVLPQLRIMQWPCATWCKLEVQYTVGEGVLVAGDGTETPVRPPELALLAMKMIAGHFWANRESQDLPPGAMRLLELNGRLEA